MLLKWLSTLHQLLFQIQGGSAPPQPGVEIPTGAFVAKITNDAREEEMEENMQQVMRFEPTTFYFIDLLKIY